MKKYVLFGSGVRAARILRLLGDNFKPAYIIDNNTEKQGSDITINEQVYHVYPPDVVGSECLDDVEIIIGYVKTEEMLGQLETFAGKRSKRLNVRSFDMLDHSHVRIYIAAFGDLDCLRFHHDYRDINADSVVFKIGDAPCAVKLDVLYINGTIRKDSDIFLKSNGVRTSDAIQFPCHNPRVYVDEHPGIESLSINLRLSEPDYKMAYEFSRNFIKNMSDVSNNINPDYVPEDDFEPVVFKPGDVKPIAYYLPQFHQIPQNSEWWEKGFTEWTNVTKAYPLFQGHYQPHLPIDVGFYDLNNIEIQKRQIELAKKYGVYGFCYYYYHYENTKLLDMPITRHLENKELDFPFCIFYANEDWTRSWVGNYEQTLIKVGYDNDYYTRVIAGVCKYLKDPRYIRVDGKPLVIVYRYKNIPNLGEFSKLWKDYCKADGIGDIMLLYIATDDFPAEPQKYGFDGLVEFRPHNNKIKPVSHRFALYSRNFNASVMDYKQLVESKLYADNYNCPVYRNVFPNWDNTARRQSDALIYHGSTPDLYKKWLSDIIEQAKRQQNSIDKYVFINAWNEWAEGAHLEPDRKYGYAYLRATREAVAPDSVIQKF